MASHADTSARANAQTPAALDFLWLEITGKCNLHCVHCYADSGPQQPLHQSMSARDWEDILERAAALHCTAVQFIGGEPTMHPQLPELIARARELGYRTVEVYTNGTMFTPRVKEAFLRHRVDLAFSVYAANAPTHDRVTRREGSLSRTLESIRWALAAGLEVRVGVIEMDANAGQAEQTEALLRKMGVTRIGIDGMRGLGRGETEPAMDARLGQLCGGCAQGRIAVAATGDIYPCVFSRFWPVGHVRQDLRVVLEGIPIRTFEREMQARHRLHAAGDDDENIPCAPKIPCQPKMHCAPKDPDCLPVLGPEKPCNPWGPTCQPKMKPGSIGGSAPSPD